MRVKEAMHYPVRTIRPESTVAEAAEQMRQFSIEHLVVTEGRRMVGVISDDDVSRVSGEDPVSNAMSRRVITISPEESISRAANKMRGHSIDCLVVTDEDSGMKGIITTTDILSVIGRMGHPERMVMRDRGLRRRKGR